MPAVEVEHTTVMDAARTGDSDRYLAALLAPTDVRDDLLALAAYSGEIARIPRIVSDPMIGEIRLQWWRDALPELVRGATTGNPVADALGSAIRRHGLPVGLLLGILDARAFELYADPMPDESSFRAYLAKTEGALGELALRVVGSWPPGTAASAGISAGQAVGIARVLLGLPHLLAKGRCVLPANRLVAAGVSLADLAATPLPDKARALLAGFVSEARAEQVRIKSGWRGIPQTARIALLPIALVEPQLRAFEKATHHPGRDLATILPIVRVWRIWSAEVLGRL